MIEFEIALFKILLLVAVLSSKPPGRKWALFVIAGGFLLALVPPPFDFPVPWEIVLGLTLPLLFWQNARRIVHARWAGQWKDLVIWVIAAVLFALILLTLKALALPGALLFGLVASSMIWSASENHRRNSVISLIGPFTLIFLLAEVEPLIQTPSQYIGGIFSGLFSGAMIAFGAVHAARKLNPKYRNWITLGQIYFAYGFALLAGISAVATSLASVITYATLGIYQGLWPRKQMTPAPLNSWPGFSLILALFLLLGWQAHYPPSNLVLFEALAGFGIGFIIAWVGQRLDLEPFSRSIALWRIGLRVSLLVFSALLIWPHETMTQPLLLAYAFGIAIVNLLAARVILDYFLSE